MDSHLYTFVYKTAAISPTLRRLTGASNLAFFERSAAVMANLCQICDTRAYKSGPVIRGPILFDDEETEQASPRRFKCAQKEGD